jgi:hypothetical protein
VVWGCLSRFLSAKLKHPFTAPLDNSIAICYDNNIKKGVKMTDQKKILGEQAMGIISDYPLYASTSGITYDQAIAIAKIVDEGFYKATKDIIIT